MAEKFDFEAALKAVQSGQSITGKDGVLGPLVKQLTEAALEGELESHLADEVADNRRNGKSRNGDEFLPGSPPLEVRMGWTNGGDDFNSWSHAVAGGAIGLIGGWGGAAAGALLGYIQSGTFYM